MDCDRFQGALSAAYDGELEGQDQLAFERHAAACGACRTALGEYRRALDGLSPALHRLVDAEHPMRPFPRAQKDSAPGPGLAGWLGPMRYAALGGLAASVLLVFLMRRPADPPALPAETTLAAADCPWKKARPEELVTSLTFPVVADDCIDHRYELIAASVVKGKSCTENVRLTYRAGDRQLVLEQHPDPRPTVCPHGDPVELGHAHGCFERLAKGLGSLRWSHGDRAFHLVGEVEPPEAAVLARNISENLEF